MTKARSLRNRLLLGAMATVFAALAIAWLAMTLLFERHLERRLGEDLTRQGLQLAAAVADGPDGSPRMIDRPPSDARFEEPASGLYWQASNAKGALRSRSLWDQTLARSTLATAVGWGSRVAAGPFGRHVLVVERRVRPDHAGPPILVQVAQDVAGLHAARGAFGRELAGFLALLWIFLTGSAWMQVKLGLRPFARVGADLGRLKGSSADRLTGDYPREIVPLVEAINALADAREVDLARARRRAADLAHGLKTPLSALAAQSRRAREAGASRAADGLDRAIEAIGEAIEAELARTRVTNIRKADSLAADVIRSVAEVIERTEAAPVVIDIEVPGALRVPIAEEDLTELMGGLMENAARHARRRVLVTGRSDDRGVSLSVEDDGPGITADSRAEALRRGGRLDQAPPGEGLGLSIACELAEATGGRMTLRKSMLGGLSAQTEWPPQ
jgi:signal transduction histidine kinase